MTSAVIMGAAETPFSRRSDLSDLEIIGDAIRLALQDAGIAKDDVDGLAICANVLPDDSSYIATHLGFELRWTMKADFGGASSLISMIRARQAIESGAADVVVAVGGGNRADFPELHHDALSPQLDYMNRSFVLPYGYGGPNSSFGLVQRRHMYEYGTTLEQLGIIATTFRRHAALNDNALLREPMTIEDYIESPLISDPIRKLDCVMRCAGGAAVVLCSDEFAAGLSRRPVHMGASAENHAHQVGRGTPDRLETGFVAIRDGLFADVSRESLDFLQLYDDYPIAVLKQLEDLGFCDLGDGGPFLESTDISIGGDLPINTGGGLLSGGQPRLGGGFIPVVEAVRQLRGEAGPRQLPDAARGFVSGIGLIDYVSNLVVTSGMILSKDAA